MVARHSNRKSVPERTAPLGVVLKGPQAQILNKAGEVENQGGQIAGKPIKAERSFS